MFAFLLVIIVFTFQIGIAIMDLSDDSSDESTPVDALESFREKWQKELVVTTSEKVQKLAEEKAISEDDISTSDKEVIFFLFQFFLSINQ